METKKCNECEIDKPLREYYKNKHTKDGLATKCKHCEYLKRIQYNKINEKKIKEYKHKYYSINRDKYLQKRKLQYVIEKEKNINKSNEQKEYDKIKIKEISKKYNKKFTEKLNDLYIIRLLKLKGLSEENIKDNPEIIEVQRLIIKTKRLCKTLQN